MRGSLVVVGDWFTGEPGRRPNGAVLAAVLAARTEPDVALVTTVDGTAAAAQLRDAVGGQAAVYPVPLQAAPLAGERRALDLTSTVREVIRNAGAVLVSDYGQGMAADREMRKLLAQASLRVPVVWDPHRRGFAPVRGVRVATPNRAAAAALVPQRMNDGDRAAVLAQRWGAESVAITLGHLGALCYSRISGSAVRLAAAHQHRIAPASDRVEVLRAPAATVDVAPPGDQFAPAVTVALLSGATTEQAVEHAVGATAA